MNVKRLFALAFLAFVFALSTIDRSPTARAEDEPVTFTKQIARLLQQRCQVCHHTGDIAPFSLVTYSEAKLFAEVIHGSTESREMPPWKPLEGCGEFAGERRLTNEEIELFGRWLAAGTPEGKPDDLPPPLQFNETWRLGSPDLVLQPEADYEVMIGDDLYRCFSLSADWRGDRFLAAIDVRPGARGVVHHATLYLDETGESKRLDEDDPLPGFNCPIDASFTKTPIAWWAPGEAARFEPSNTGWRIPQGARLVLKIHYHVHHGGGQKDRTQVGVYFAREPVTKALRTLVVSNTTFAIPAGEEHYPLTAFTPPLEGAHAYAIAPHLQLLGREVEVEAQRADGSAQCLIRIEEWDSHWQSLYHFKEPVALAAGTRLHLAAVYDNSTNNSENPNFPPKVVRYGERTEDETCMAYVKVTLDAERLALSSPQLNSVSIDADGQLLVGGKGFQNGADIEIDGKRVSDTRNHKKKGAKRLLSSDAWKALLSAGKAASVTVLNADGVRTAALSFTR
jgi:hypothetical protein